MRRYVVSTDLVRQHTRLGGNLTIWAVLLLALVTAVVVWDHFSGRRLDTQSAGPGAATTIEVAGLTMKPAVVRRVALTLGVLSIVVAAFSTFWVYRIGHSGAKASWSVVQHRIDTGQQVGGDRGR